MNIISFRRPLGRAFDAQMWRPSNAKLIWDHLIYQHRNRDSGLTDRDHLIAAAKWLERAQDVTGNGGVAGRFLLGQGWTSAYPETTGYIIPTFLALSTELGSSRFLERANRAVDFLLSLQLANGAFPGGEIEERQAQPSIFNTSQILGGLIAWHASSRDGRALKRACRAGDWLVSMQDPDGAWRRHTYNNLAVTYSAHASCWLAELGKHTGGSSYLDAAAKHLDWVLGHQNIETGWFDLSGCTPEDHEARRAVTHSIAYTLWGLLVTAEVLKRSDGLEAVEKAAAGIARRLELSGWLPGVLDHRWRSQATYTCSTGNAQLALIWLRLFTIRGDVRLLNAALKAIDCVKVAQPMSSRNPGIRGGIPGSYPIWGDYIYMAVPNWAAKFFIDALIAKKRVFEEFSTFLDSNWQIPGDVPQSLPNTAVGPPRQTPKVIMYSAPGSQKVQQMLTAWSSWNFKPDAIVIENRAEAGFVARLIKRIEEDGFRWILKRLFQRATQRAEPSAPGSPGYQDLMNFCHERRIPILKVGPLDTADSLAAISALQPDLAIHAGGGGILRLPLLKIPRLGTLNAHMGILPQYRGMNVAEWAFLEGGPVGCTVHLIAPGIDDGDILCVRRVDMTDVRNIRGLRERVDEAQIALLGDVLRFIVNTGKLPPRRKQASEEGRQFFRMHPEIASILERRINGSTVKNYGGIVTA